MQTESGFQAQVGGKRGEKVTKKLGAERLVLHNENKIVGEKEEDRKTCAANMKRRKGGNGMSCSIAKEKEFYG